MRRCLALLALAALCGSARGADDDLVPRRYVPDRNAGFEHMSLDITPDFQQRTISGEITFTFKPMGQALDELVLNAENMTVASVQSSESIEAWQWNADKLTITFSAAIPAEHEARVTIRYSAQPQKGLFFRTPELGYPAGDEHLFTQGESTDNRAWYPCPDAPNEKYTTEITCHVPAGMTVLSNGKLVSQEKDAAGLTAFHWSQDKPHANYLVSLVAGYFQSVEDKHNDTPLALYYPPSDAPEASNSFVDTRDIMDFYEKDIGLPFPWAKYYQVMVRDFVAGGMENTTLTSLTENTLFTPATENLRSSEGLVSHEMAHQWFGDLVTCREWSEIWLNEGFATFYALLYHQHKAGNDDFLYQLYRSRRQLCAISNDVVPIVYRKYVDPNKLFSWLPYDKGSYVLRMLRAQLGDDLYRACIKDYLERHQFGNVTTEDLESAIEEVSGRSYDQFFDQWVYHAHYPELAAAYSWDEKSKLARISIQQKQTLSDDVLLFNFPLTIAFKGKFGSVEKTITVKEKSGDFYFALPEAPTMVLLDPRAEVLARIEITLPPAMIAAQLADDSEVVGRLLAVAALKDQPDHESIGKLRDALEGDPFYGVRVEAAGVLANIHSQESLEALLAAPVQTDARVRNAVAAALGAFYNEAAFEAETNALATEKNPDILAQHLQGLAKYGRPETQALLLPFLQARNFHNTIAQNAIAAMRTQDDPSYAGPIRQTLTDRRDDFTTRGFSDALDTLAYLQRHSDKKDDALAFLTGFVNDKNSLIRVGAIKALGTLGDPRAAGTLQTFASASRDIPEQPVAEAALAAIRAADTPSNDLKDLRNSVLDLEKANQKLRNDLEDLQKKFDSRPPPKTSKSKQPKS